VARTEIAEKMVSAADEEAAIDKIQAELDRPYGLLGLWRTTAVEIVEVEAVEGAHAGLASGPVPGRPVLLSVKDAAEYLGVSRATLYRRVSTGELESVRIGSRCLISRDALTKFIEVNSRAGS
jgi:excisionase family DNA binding protein